MNCKKSIFWFRRDLRLNDNVGLYFALSQSEQVVPVFIFDTIILHKLKNKHDKRVIFIYQSLKEIQAELNMYGKQLLVRIGDPKIEIPKLSKELEVDCVFTNKDYENYARERDDNVKKTLAKAGVLFVALKDQVVFEEEEVLNSLGEPYRIFTPYKNAWFKKLTTADYKDYTIHWNSFASKQSLNSHEKMWDWKDIGFIEDKLSFECGQSGAQNALKVFSNKLSQYHLERDLFFKTGTSMLSVHLRFGTISIRNLLRFALSVKGQGSDSWVSELIWREFYKMILFCFPHVEEHAFKKEFDKIAWHNNEEQFERWKSGQTGFPIVDAAMRYFAKTGWIHNRLRMVVASFLCKDLLIDYKKGENYFAENLIDFDLSANNGGWQWCASTGCDAQPYFRVFNPESQSKKFDSAGNFIKKVCPELALIPEKFIHAPHKMLLQDQKNFGCLIGKHYPAPCVDHTSQRLKAISLFK